MLTKIIKNGFKLAVLLDMSTELQSYMPSSVSLLAGMEFVGEVLAETIGLNTSNYQVCKPHLFLVVMDLRTLSVKSFRLCVHNLGFWRKTRLQWVIDTAEEDERRRRRRAELDHSREELVQDFRELKEGQLHDQAEAGNDGEGDSDGEVGSNR